MTPKFKYALAKQCLLYGALGLLISCSSLPTGQTDQAEPSDNDTLFYVEVSQGVRRATFLINEHKQIENKVVSDLFVASHVKFIKSVIAQRS